MDMTDKCMICGDVVTVGEFVFGEYLTDEKDIDRLCEDHAKRVLKFLWKL